MSFNRDVWVISKGNLVKKVLQEYLKTDDCVYGYDYKLSGLGNYLLKPQPLSIERTIIGYEVEEIETSKFSLPPFYKKMSQPKSKRYVSELKTKFHFANENKFLIQHLDAFNSELLKYDVYLNNLNSIDLKHVKNINALYEDIDGTIYSISIPGKNEEQLNFIKENYGKNIKIVWKKGAYLEEGIFNLKAKEFTSYNHREKYSLFLFKHEGKSMGFVYSEDKFHYWLHDARILRYLFILQHAIDMDCEFYSTIKSCLTKENHALYMEFNQKPISFVLNKYTPYVYNNVFKLLNISKYEQKDIINALNNSLDNIGLKFINYKNPGQSDIMMKITFLHNLAGTALLQKINPKLYQTICSLASESEIGSYYVLEKKILKVGVI